MNTERKTGRPLWLRAIPLTLPLVLGAALAFAADAPLLKNNQVTEEALVDALAVEPPPAASGATRGFKPGAAAAGTAAPSAAATKPAGPGKANLLIVFATASSALTPESMTALDTVAKAMQTDKLAGLTFKVEGHADARGDAEVNRLLSQARAEAVVNYLVSKQGILPERLVAVGKGATEPMNRDKVDAPENRRVSFVTVRN
jgi:outer membrane protein OmpA-like peptidoglycan-associated protein